MDESAPARDPRGEARPGGEVLRVEGLVKHFRPPGEAPVPAVDGIDLALHRGELMVLLGPSGCGKTTLLRSVAGLDTPEAGRITIAGDTVLDAARGLNRSPEKRRISMVFQSYALWPHMRVADIVGFPVRMQRRPRAEVRARVERALAAVHMSEQAPRYPGQLSGGQQQRVALARALAARTDLILFDEPLSNIDAKVREKLRIELTEMQRELGFSALYVTHDQEEAMQLGTRIAVLERGKVAQIAEPRVIYTEPATEYVARFIGQTNEAPATVLSEVAGSIALQTQWGRCQVVARGGQRLLPGAAATVLWRPEDAVACRPGPDPAPDGLIIDGEVVENTFVGTRAEVIVRCGEHRFVVRVAASESWHRGDPIRLVVAAERLMTFPSADR